MASQATRAHDGLVIATDRASEMTYFGRAGEDEMQGQDGASDYLAGHSPNLPLAGVPMYLPISDLKVRTVKVWRGYEAVELSGQQGISVTTLADQRAEAQQAARSCTDQVPNKWQWTTFPALQSPRPPMSSDPRPHTCWVVLLGQAQIRQRIVIHAQRSTANGHHAGRCAVVAGNSVVQGCYEKAMGLRIVPVACIGGYIMLRHAKALGGH